MKTQTILKVGHSLAVSIPSKAVKKMGLTVGQQVISHTDFDNQKLILEFPDAKQLSLLVKSDKSE